jgi:type VI secretion system secreted protein Hcp
VAVDFFIKFDGIKGESADAKHKDEIDIESWSWGETQVSGPSPGSGGGAGKVAMQDFHFVMRLNRASPSLMQACATGKHIKTALLSARKAGGKGQVDYLTFKFHDVLVSSFQTGGMEQADVPTDSVSFNFAKIEVEYKQQQPNGSYVPGGQFKFDLKANKPY